MTRNFKILMLVSFMVAVLFIAFPEADLRISALFYDNSRGFFLNRHPFFEGIHNSVQYVVKALIAAYVVLLFLNYIRKNPLPFLTNRVVLYLMLVLALGPGLVVNSVFKDQWGRARPLQTENFGGNKKFTPAFILSDQCERNCSFTSGDPSVGFSLFAWALIARKRKKQCMALALGLGTLWGANRVIQGAHFFSDVVFSGVFVYIVAYALYHFIIKPTRSVSE